MTGPNPEYAKMINYFETDYEFMSWHGYIADYPHACQILSAAEISTYGTLYDPLTTNLQDTRNLSIANKYIEATLAINKETFYEAIQLGYAKHYNNEGVINAFIDHYEYTLMKDNKRDVLAREKIIMLMGKKGNNVIE